MSSKSKGIRKEWALKRKLEEKGYLVMRSSASKTGVDLLAGKAGKILAIQVQTSEYIYPEKVEDLKRYAEAFQAQPLLAITRKGKWVFLKTEQLKRIGKMMKIVF